MTEHNRALFESSWGGAAAGFADKSQPIVSSDFTIRDFPHLIQARASLRWVKDFPAAPLFSAGTHAPSAHRVNNSLFRPKTVALGSESQLCN